MKILAISDLHSFYKETIKALEDTGCLDEADSVVLVIGDVLDRGDEPFELIDYLLDLLHRGKLIYVKGNHELRLDEALDDIAKGFPIEVLGASHHVGNGTAQTILRLAGMNEKEAVMLPKELVERVKNSRYYKELLPAAVNYYETDNYIFTHGWLPCIISGYGSEKSFSYDVNWRNAGKLQWRIATTLNGMKMAVEYGIKEPGKTVVCGHFHTSYGHANISKICTEDEDDAIYTPFYSDGIIAIDGCTAESGIVNCVVIEDTVTTAEG